MGKHLDPGSNLLDLGTENPFTPQLKAAGYSVSNTQGENLDDDFKKIAQTACDCVTAFEIFEHLLAPYNILKELKSISLFLFEKIKVFNGLFGLFPLLNLFLDKPLKHLKQRNNEWTHEWQVSSRHKLPRKVERWIHLFSHEEQPDLLLCLLFHEGTWLVSRQGVVYFLNQLVNVFALVNVYV